MKKIEDIENLDDLLLQSTMNLEPKPRYDGSYIALLKERLEFFENVVDGALREMDCLPECSKARRKYKKELKTDRTELCDAIRFCAKCGIPIDIELARMEQLENFLLLTFPDVRPTATFN